MQNCEVSNDLNLLNFLCRMALLFLSLKNMKYFIRKNTEIKKILNFCSSKLCLCQPNGVKIGVKIYLDNLIKVEILFMNTPV